MSGDRQRAGIYLPAWAGAALFTIFPLVPLALALAAGDGPDNRWRELSGALAMSGFTIILLQFLTSGRFRFVSGRGGLGAGIDATMRLHQLAARTALAFLLAHPLLYAVPRLLAGGGAGDMLAGMFLSGRLRSGVLAWLLMILVVAMAIWRDRLPIRYESWRMTHGLGAGLVAVLGAHHTLAVGTYAAAPALAAFWLTLSAIALASLAHVYVIRPLHMRRHVWKVSIVEPAAERTWRVVIEAEGHRPAPFIAGQFAWLNLGHSPFSLTEHPFSFASAPSFLPRLEFIIKESGDFTRTIGAIRPGTTAYLDGPHGSFTLAGRDKPGSLPRSEPAPLVLIAGGAGIAPMLSILRDLSARGERRRQVTLIYGNRLETQIVARQELESLQAEAALRLVLPLGEPPTGWPHPRGVLNRDVLAQCLGDKANPKALYLVCGPPAMMDSVESALLALGVPGERVVCERFNYD